LPMGSSAEIFGTVVAKPAGKVIINTEVGGTRVLGMLAGAPLPRIC